LQIARVISIPAGFARVPRPVKDAYIKAIEDDKNGYALTQGMPVLRDKLQAEVDAQFGHDDREVFVCSGTSGGLNLSVLSLINPGDEVIYFDPFFVMYPAIIELTGGKSVKVSIYPDFKLDMDKLEAAITDKTKMIILNTHARGSPRRRGNRGQARYLSGVRRNLQQVRV